MADEVEAGTETGSSEPGAGAEASEVSSGDDGLRREDLAGTPSRLPLMLLIVVALIGGFVIARVTSGGDDGAGTDATAEEPTDGGTAATADDPIPFPVGDQNREGYWGFASLERVVSDTFDRADAPVLGTAGTGQPWQAVAGTWGVRADRAVTSGGADGAPNIAVVPDGSGDGLTEVTMMVVEEGAGLVFRYLDPENYWSVTANPGVGSWSVNRVIDGDTELVSEVPAPTNDEITVSVTQDDSVVRLLLDGVEYLSLTDTALGDQLQGGIIAAPDTVGDARWDRFLVMRFRDQTEADGATTTTAG